MFRKKWRLTVVAAYNPSIVPTRSNETIVDETYRFKFWAAYVGTAWRNKSSWTAIYSPTVERI